MLDLYSTSFKSYMYICYVYVQKKNAYSFLGFSSELMANWNFKISILKGKIISSSQISAAYDVTESVYNFSWLYLKINFPTNKISLRQKLEHFLNHIMPPEINVYQKQIALRMI